MRRSRDAKDPRDEMRGMNDELQGEFDRDQRDDTGGQEHATRAEREGRPGGRNAAGRPTAGEVGRSTREPSDAEAPRVPRAPPVTDAGGTVPAPVEPSEGEPREG